MTFKARHTDEPGDATERVLEAFHALFQEITDPDLLNAITDRISQLELESYAIATANESDTYTGEPADLVETVESVDDYQRLQRALGHAWEQKSSGLLQLTMAQIDW